MTGSKDSANSINIENIENAVMQPRDYQYEMFEESLRQNIIVAMDTGSGKTAIAILRIREELSKDCDSKTIWFLCPTVALAEQQSDVIRKHIPYCRTRLICGRDGVDTWETKRVWDNVLHNVQIVVCTHKVLQNALMHGSVWLSRISLLVFDEAHHCVGDHPANSIMRDYYHAQLRRQESRVPHILGLTASPINNSAQISLSKIEASLNAVSKSPRVHRSSLIQHVHRPALNVVTYSENILPHTVTVDRLDRIIHSLDIDQDPQILVLERQGDLELKAKTRLNCQTYCQKTMKRLLRIALEIHQELGPSVARFYVQYCVKSFMQASNHKLHTVQDSEDENRIYLTNHLSPLEPDGDVAPPDSGGLSLKLRALVEFLLQESKTGFRGIIFTNTRASTVLIAMCLSHHPELRSSVRVGTFVGTSAHQNRRSDLTDISDMSKQDSTIEDLRTGIINLVVATTVLEEGIDISACNLVVCFDKPKNLRSFLQRRGRARTEESKFVLMTTTSDDRSLQEWQALEQKMIEMYQDEMRQIEELKALEQVEEHDSRILRVDSTGAEISLKESVPHIYHFCSKATKAQFANALPIFQYSGDKNCGISCRLTLPSCVDASLRRFDSIRVWRSEKGARRDAAFNAYRALYDAGLLNEHLLPAPKLDPELAKIYEKIAKRPPLAEVQPQIDPWPEMAMEWRTCSVVRVYLLNLVEPTGDKWSVRMLAPCHLPPMEPFTLYVSRSITWNVEIVDTKELLAADDPSVAQANTCMKIILETIFPQLQQLVRPSFALIFTPVNEPADYTTWISRYCGFIRCSTLPSSGVDSVLIVDENLKRWQPVSLNVSDSPLLHCVPFPKRRDFLHPVPANPHPTAAPGKETSNVLLNPRDCFTSRLPGSYVHLARSLPSIMHRIGISLTISALQQQIFAPVSLSFSSPSALLTALSTGLSGEANDYQRLEFLGDALLKTHVAATLMAIHPTWPEGYLSTMKDRIVSNGRLALVAQDLGLDKFILTVPLRARRWRPKSNAMLLSEQSGQEQREKRSMSTKTLADVVEALIGAAYEDDKAGGQEAGKVLSMLKLFLPELQWHSLHSAASALHAAAADEDTEPHPGGQDISSTHIVREVESILGYTFTHRSLLTEALTHPSHMAPSASRSRSYERLEFLGDALLDYIVTTKIWASHCSSLESSVNSHANPANQPVQPDEAHHTGLTVDDMHQLRINTVNGSFLAFCAFSASTTVETNPLPPLNPASSSSSSPSSSRHTQSKNNYPPNSNTTSPTLNSPRNHSPPPSIRSTIPLPAYMHFSPSTPIPSRLHATQSRFAALQPSISAALQHTAPHTYPWRLLAAFAPDKIFSDIVEALLGAIFIDSAGDMRCCEAFLARLGVLDWLQRVLSAGGKVGRHPKERLGVVAQGRRVRYVVFCRGKRVQAEDVGDIEDRKGEGGGGRDREEDGGDEKKDDGGAAEERDGRVADMPADVPTDIPTDIPADMPADDGDVVDGEDEWQCVALVGGERVASVRGSNRMEVEIAAAERAVEVLRTREDGEREVEDEDGLEEGGVKLTKNDDDEARDEAQTGVEGS